jgi:hypothetical protein
MIKYYETGGCYYKINFDNSKYDVIYKFNMHIYTDNCLPSVFDVNYFTLPIYKEITEEQYNYILEI